MTLLTELFSNWIGILSFSVIAAMLGMVGYFIHLFLQKNKPSN